MKATFVRSDPETTNIRTFWFRPERPMNYIAGQYTELYLPHENADDRGEKRWFTLSSAPGGELVSITTKFSDPCSTFKEVLQSLKPETEIDLAEPMGDFVLPKDESRPLIFVAGGIGMTPFHSIAQWLVDSNQTRDIQLIYGVRDSSEIALQEPFKTLGVPTKIHIGDDHITAEKILDEGRPNTEHLIFVSGPEPMTEALEKSLKIAGIQDTQLVLDFFPNYKNDYST